MTQSGLNSIAEVFLVMALRNNLMELVSDQALFYTYVFLNTVRTKAWYPDSLGYLVCYLLLGLSEPSEGLLWMRVYYTWNIILYELLWHFPRRWAPLTGFLFTNRHVFHLVTSLVFAGILYPLAWPLYAVSLYNVVKSWTLRGQVDVFWTGWGWNISSYRTNSMYPPLHELRRLYPRELAMAPVYLRLYWRVLVAKTGGS